MQNLKFYRTSSILLRPIRVLIGLLILTQGGSPTAVAAEDGDRQIAHPSHVLAANFAVDLIFKALLSSYLDSSGGFQPSEEDKIQAVARAEQVAVKFLGQKRDAVWVESLEELDKLRRNFFPPIYTLQIWAQGLDRLKLPPYLVIYTTNPDVERELDLWSSTLKQRLSLSGVSLAHFDDIDRKIEQSSSILKGPLSIAKVDLPNIQSRQVRQLILQIRKFVLDNVNAIDSVNPFVLPPEMRLFFVEAFQKQVDGFLQRIEGAGQSIVQTGNIQIGEEDWQRFFEIFFAEYFKNIDMGTKLSILAEISEQVKEPTVMDLFAIAIRNGGPLLQKVLQGVAREKGFSDQLRSIFKLLEQDGKPVPWHFIERRLQFERLPFELVDIGHKAVGVGTMAQGHIANIIDTDGRPKRVFIRILKEGIAERLVTDVENFVKVAKVADQDPLLRQHNFPLMTPLIEETYENVAEELVVEQVAINQRKAAKVYTREKPIDSEGLRFNLSIRVPEVLGVGQTSDGSKSTMMVQEAVNGMSLDSFAEENPATARKIVEEIARLWLEKALVATPGFFHADLHTGNILVERTGNEIRAYLLDFGIVGSSEKTSQNRFMQLVLATATSDADLLTRLVWDMSIPEKNKLTQEELLDRVRQQLDQRTQRGLSGWPLPDLLKVAINNGIRFKKEFGLLGRGASMIIGLLEAHDSKLDYVSTLKTILRAHPSRLIKALNSDRRISSWEWLKIFWKQITKGEPLLKDSGGLQGISSNGEETQPHDRPLIKTTTSPQTKGGACRSLVH